MGVEKKIQRTGGETPYVYLPKEWVDELFSQGRVVIQRLPLGLFLTPPSPPVSVARYRLSCDSAHDIKEAVLSAYTQGHREVQISFPASTSKTTSEVSRFASRLIGVVSEVKKDEARLREYTEHEKVDLGLLIRGLFSKCQEMAVASRDMLRDLGDAKSGPEEGLEALARVEDDADYLSFGLFRLLSSRSRYVESPGEQLVDLLFYSIINYAAERYCDALYGMADAVRHVLDSNGDPATQRWRGAISKLALVPDESLKFLDKAADVVLARDGRAANSIREEVRGNRRKSWEPAVARSIRELAVASRPALGMYPATQVGGRLLESGTYLESFFSRTSQFHFAGTPSTRAEA